MLDLTVTQIEAHLSWRWLLQVALLSGGLTLAALWSFRDDAASRRGLGVAAIWLLALVPVVLLLLQPRYQIGVQHLPSLPTLSPVPWVVLVAWMLLALWGCAKVAIHVWRSQRDFRYLVAVDDAELRLLTGAYCSRLNMPEPLLAYGDSACASSLGRATVMLPEKFLSWPKISQRAVIAHELVHLQRRDDRFMIALQALARCYLFCPWLHVLYARFVHSLEEACDERAAQLVGARPDYLEGLAGAALHEGGSSYAAEVNPKTAVETSAKLIDASQKSLFMRRLARLLDKQRFFEVQAGPLTGGMGVGLLVLCAITTFEFVEIPRAQFVDMSKRSVSIVPLQALEPTAESGASTAHASHWLQPEVRVINTAHTSANGLATTNALHAERITPAIVYPGRALMDGVEGQVLMEFSIAGDGSTVRARVLRSTHPQYFDSTAKRAVQQMVYAPNYETGFSGVNAAFRDARQSERVAIRRVQKLFVFDLGKDQARQALTAQASTQ